MDIEALIEKHTNKTGWAFAHDSCEKAMRAALTEQAEAYEQRIRQLEAELSESRERIRQLEGALEIIAGRKQCIDNTMGNADVAMAVLAAAPAKEGE